VRDTAVVLYPLPAIAVFSNLVNSTKV